MPKKRASAVATKPKFICPHRTSRSTSYARTYPNTVPTVAFSAKRSALPGGTVVLVASPMPLNTAGSLMSTMLIITVAVSFRLLVSTAITVSVYDERLLKSRLGAPGAIVTLAPTASMANRDASEPALRQL